ncbi:MAG: histidine kinase [Alphaproteobacteria bacterium]|nr:histidine kinase [Alphaproteobacteria bacterium]
MPRPERQRLGELDIADALSRYLPALPTQIAFGIACAGAAIGARVVVDLIAPGAGPFSLIYPTILIATLFGRWQAGVTTLAISFLYAWYAVLPYPGSFAFEDPGDVSRTLVNAAASTVIMIFAELFRRAVRRAMDERAQESQARALLLRELDHRTKNNFAIVASLLDVQRRHVASDETREALGVAHARVLSFAAAHTALYSDLTDIGAVDMREYLQALIGNLSDALFLSGAVRIELDAAPLTLPRDRAVAIGLVLNEAVTNAAKHAYAPGESGVITVSFGSHDGRWRLAIRDDGRGMPQGAVASSGSGLGGRLIAAFAQMAGGEIAYEPSLRGAAMTVTEAA